MMKLYFYVLLFIFLSGCFHETSLISNYGQRIVKIPNQKETTDALNATKNVNKLVNIFSSIKGISCFFLVWNFYNPLTIITYE